MFLPLAFILVVGNVWAEAIPETVKNQDSAPLAIRGNWPHWRGPNGDCHAQAQLPAAWPEKLVLRWSVRAGQGYSSPIVASGRVFLHSRTENTEDVNSFDAVTGKEVGHWSQPVTIAPQTEGYQPAATPVWHEGKIVIHSITGSVFCFDELLGKVIWKRDLLEDLNASGPQFGPSASPLIVNGCVVLPVGDSVSGCVVGLDLMTGKTVWQAGSSPPGYATAVAGRVAGVDQLFVFGLRDLQIFKKAGPLYEVASNYEYDAGEGNQCTPAILGDDTVLITNEENTAVLRMAVENEKLKSAVLWSVPHPGGMSSPLVYAERIYLFSKGAVLCLSPADGATLSSFELSGEYCSMVRIDNVLLCLSDEGRLIVVDVSGPAMKKLADYKVSDEKTGAHLTVVDGFLFVRSSAELRCLAFSTTTKLPP